MQIGEFGFILLSMANQLNLIPTQVYMLLMGESSRSNHLCHALLKGEWACLETARRPSKGWAIGLHKTWPCGRASRGAAPRLMSTHKCFSARPLCCCRLGAGVTALSLLITPFLLQASARITPGKSRLSGAGGSAASLELQGLVGWAALLDRCSLCGCLKVPACPAWALPSWPSRLRRFSSAYLPPLPLACLRPVLLQKRQMSAGSSGSPVPGLPLGDAGADVQLKLQSATGQELGYRSARGGARKQQQQQHAQHSRVLRLLAAAALPGQR